MAEDVWGLMQGSDPLTTLVVSILAGFASGGVGGAALTYYLRRRGKVRCIVPRVKHHFEILPETPSAATLDVTFTLRFYNEREVGTIVGPVHLDVYTKTGKRVTSTLI